MIKGNSVNLFFFFLVFKLAGRARRLTSARGASAKMLGFFLDPASFLDLVFVTSYTDRMFPFKSVYLFCCICFSFFQYHLIISQRVSVLLSCPTFSEVSVNF